MWLSKYILITLFITNIILITNSKIKSYANLNLAFKFNLKVIIPASIQVFKDKQLTSKLFTFEGISFDLEGTGKIMKGLRFDLTKMVNSQSADNFFSKVAKKISTGVYFLYFSNLPGCDVLAKKNQAINLFAVEIGLVSLSNEYFYLAISFPEGESAVDKYSKLIHDECQNYTNMLKTKLNEYYDLAKNYFKVKNEKENIKAKNIDVEDINKKENQLLQNANTDKQVQVEKLDQDKVELEKATREKNDMGNDLKRKYSDLNNVKEQKAKLEKELEDLKKQSEQIGKEVETEQNNLESFEKTKDEKRTELEAKNAQINQTEKKLDEMDKALKAQKDGLKKINDDIYKVNAKVAEAQSGIADHKIRINSEQNNIDNLKNVDSQKALSEKNKTVDDLIKKLDQLRKELNDINKEVLDSEENVKKNSDEVNNLLNDPGQKVQVKKEELTKIMIEIKQYLDNTKKLFPLLPDIYWDNIWRFISVNHSEALNYLKGMRPSIYGLYDNLYTKKHPEKTINDVDFIPRPLPEVIAKARRLKKRKL